MTVDKQHYNVVVLALQLACETLKKSTLDLRHVNIDILPYFADDRLMGYFLMKAENLIIEKGKEDTNGRQE